MIILRKRLAWLLVFALTFYLAFGTFLYFGQEQMLFRPRTVAADHDYNFRYIYQDVTLESEDSNLHAALFKNSEERALKLVLYFKGNAGTIKYSEKMASTFLALGYDVLTMDYRGYGKSRGVLSEEALLEDAIRWYDWAAKHYRAEDIRLVGYSLGSAFASHVSANRPVEHLILFAPFKSMMDIAQRRYPLYPFSTLIKYQFRNDLKLESAQLKTLSIYHGTSDRVVPYATGKALADYLDGKARFITLDGVSHGRLPYDTAVLEDIKQRW